MDCFDTDPTHEPSSLDASLPSRRSQEASRQQAAHQIQRVWREHIVRRDPIREQPLSGAITVALPTEDVQQEGEDENTDEYVSGEERKSNEEETAPLENLNEGTSREASLQEEGNAEEQSSMVCVCVRARVCARAHDHVFV